MKVLFIVGSLPSEEKPWRMPFVQSQIDSLRDIGVDIDILNLTSLFGQGWAKYIKTIVKLPKYISRDAYDLIHAHYSLCGIVGLFQHQLPLVVSLMGSDLLPVPKEENRSLLKIKLEQYCGKLVAHFSDFVIVKSEEMANRIPFCRNIAVIPNGVDFKKFCPMNNDMAKTKFHLPMNKKIILFASNPNNNNKNISLARKAFEIFINNYQTDVFLWNVWQMRHKDMPFVLNAADVLIFTSLSEGSPNLVKEAMACNLPIVSVPVGDVPYIIKGTKNCYLADYDPEIIAEKLNIVLSTGTRSNGRVMIRHLSLKKIALRIMTVYENIVANNPSK